MNAQELLERANQAFANGDYHKAASDFQRVIELHPDVGELYINLGAALKAAGDFAAAEQTYKEAIARLPKSAIAWFNLGNLLREIGRGEDALGAYQKADKLQPGTPEILNNMGAQLYDLGAVDDALKQYDAALAFRPGFADAMTNRGNALQRLCRMDEALQSLESALEIEPSNPTFTLNMAAYLAATGNHQDAIKWSSRAIDLNPEYIDAHLKKASLLIQQGNLRDGLELYEKRWLKPHWHDMPSRLDAPHWQGENLSDKHLVVWNEQGYGDAIMYARFIDTLNSRAGRLTVMCEPALHDLFRRSLPKNVDIFDLRTPPESADFHASIMSLPYLLSVSEMSQMMADPYLSPCPEACENWRQSFNLEKLQVGVVWAGNPAQAHDYARSIPEMTFSPLLTTPEINFHNLLIGARGDQLPDSRMIDNRQNLKTFGDTAAYMASLDLVISVDSAPAHLSGAIGQKTWVMLSFDPDSRYFLGRDDSPWYPTMALYRQTSPGDWSTVLDRISEDLGILKNQKKRP